jgi:hypothetical protein
MTQRAAPTSPLIQVVTGIYVLITLGVLLGAAVRPSPLAGVVSGILALTGLGCFVLAPVAYELSDGRLTVMLRLGRLRYGPVVRCMSREEVASLPNLMWGLRLFGNGGVFAGIGIFWSPALGVYRAWVTSARRADLVVLNTLKTRVLITPQDPEGFIASAASRPPPHRSVAAEMIL